jgi:hypothetical protein
VGKRFDPLLAILYGRRLSVDTPALWQAFQSLKDARNHFVHEGRAVVGKRSQVVTPPKAAELLQKAVEVVEWIEEQLPEEHRRPRQTPVTIQWNLTTSFRA